MSFRGTNSIQTVLWRWVSWMRKIEAGVFEELLEPSFHGFTYTDADVNMSWEKLSPLLRFSFAFTLLPYAQHFWHGWVGFFFSTKQFSATPAGCPTISLNPDTTHREIASDPTVKGSVPLPMPIASPGRHLCFWPIGYKFEVPTTPPPHWVLLLC